MKKLLLIMMASLLVMTVVAGEVTNHFTITILDKSQDINLKADGVARYTVRYVSTVSQQKEMNGYVLDEPREGSGMPYRGPIDRTVYWPDDFANVGDTIGKTNINGRIYLYSAPKSVESSEAVLQKLKDRREKE